jgi:hypothetical protein
MAFTDDDLKRLKEIATERLVYPMSNETLKALLARLEAAEKLILLRGTHLPNATITREIETAVWAWRKAAGK